MSLALALLLLAPAASPAPAWQTLAPGFELGRFVSPQPSDVGDSTLVVVGVDPKRYELRLLSASLLLGGKPKTAPEWAEQEGGPEASLHVKAFGTEVRAMGSYETGFWENDLNILFWPIPNVLAVLPR